MTITYAGTEIAAEPLDSGTDLVDGLLPKGDSVVQVAQATRATDAQVFPRGNRVYTVPVTITPQPYSSSGAAMIAMFMYLANLAPNGTLVLVEDAQTLSFANAAIKSMSAPYKLGASFAADLVFMAVSPSSETSES